MNENILADDFACCGGNDEKPPSHCADCPGTPPEPKGEPSDEVLYRMATGHDGYAQVSGCRDIYNAGRASISGETEELNQRWRDMRREFLFAEERYKQAESELARLRAESMLGAVEALRAMTVWNCPKCFVALAGKCARCGNYMGEEQEIIARAIRAVQRLAHLP